MTSLCGLFVPMLPVNNTPKRRPRNQNNTISQNPKNTHHKKEQDKHTTKKDKHNTTNVYI